MSSPGSMKPASAEIHLVAVAVLVRQQAALAVGDQHDHHRIGARKPLQAAGPALAPPAAVLDQRGAAAMPAAAGVLVPLGERARLAAQGQLLRRHDALHGQRAQVDDRAQLLDGAGDVAGAVLGHRQGEVPVATALSMPRNKASATGKPNSVSSSCENQASLASVRWALERIDGLEVGQHQEPRAGRLQLGFQELSIAPFGSEPIEHERRTNRWHPEAP